MVQIRFRYSMWHPQLAYSVSVAAKVSKSFQSSANRWRAIKPSMAVLSPAYCNASVCVIASFSLKLLVQVDGDGFDLGKGFYAGAAIFAAPAGLFEAA